MLTAAIVLGIYGIYFVFTLLPVLRSKKPGYSWPCLIIFGIGIVVQVLHELNVNVPSPAPAIVEFVSGWFNVK